jgi:hypothetical protein
MMQPSYVSYLTVLRAELKQLFEASSQALDGIPILEAFSAI